MGTTRRCPSTHGGFHEAAVAEPHILLIGKELVALVALGGLLARGWLVDLVSRHLGRCRRGVRRVWPHWGALLHDILQVTIETLGTVVPVVCRAVILAAGPATQAPLFGTIAWRRYGWWVLAARTALWSGFAGKPLVNGVVFAATVVTSSTVAIAPLTHAQELGHARLSTLGAFHSA